MNNYEKIGRLTEAICKAGFSSWAIFPHKQDDMDVEFLHVNLFNRELNDKEIMTQVGMCLEHPFETWLIALEDTMPVRDEYVKEHNSHIKRVPPRWGAVVETTDD